MLKKISLMIFLVLIVLLSVSSIQASDVNATDIGELDSAGDMNLQPDDNTQLSETADEESLLRDGDKNQTQIASPTTTIYYNGNYQVTLTDSNTNESLVNKTVEFSINNIAYSAATNDNGVASVKPKLKPGDYVATAYFAGDDNFNASKLSGQVKVLTTLKASAVTKYYKGSKTYQATFLDSLGKALKKKKVEITVNGKKYTKKTNDKGVASLAINLKPGTYKVTATNPSTGEKLTTSFKILTTVTASNLKKVKGDGNKFVAKFLKSNGKALAKQTVKVKINGKIYKYKTNAKGKLKLSFNSFKKGTYKVICYNKDGLSKTSTVKIFGRASTKITVGTYTFLEKDSKVIKIKFSTALDDSSKAGKKITIYVDWEPYTRTTDSKGEISLKLPSMEAGSYQIECEYNGNKFFQESYGSGYLTVLETSDTVLSVESKSLSFGNKAGTPLEVLLTAGDIPLVKKKVCFTVNDKSYNVTTDYYGIASFPIKLDVGSYTVNFTSFDDSKVKGSSGSCVIKVFKRSSSKITSDLKSSYNDRTQTFKVHLTDANGNPIKYATVEMYIDGKSYDYMETNSKGYATFHNYLSLGKYKVSFKFKGDNGHTASSSSSKTIKVVLSKYQNGINEKKASASSAYLQGSKNAPTNNGKIKALVKTLTKGLTSAVDKARAIFYYVMDNIDYDYYYGTKHAAVGTLKAKKANCVDQSHLLVSMFRTAGLKARYVQGVCTYSDGTFSHFWTQVVIDNTWVCADPVNHCNELGQINDWNTKTFKLKGKYINTS